MDMQLSEWTGLAIYPQGFNLIPLFGSCFPFSVDTDSTHKSCGIPRLRQPCCDALNGGLSIFDGGIMIGRSSIVGWNPDNKFGSRFEVGYSFGIRFDLIGN